MLYCRVWKSTGAKFVTICGSGKEKNTTELWSAAELIKTDDLCGGVHSPVADEAKATHLWCGTIVRAQ
ncbi:MAG: hypothetical protein OEY52_07855 [Gammaproteobacteria bacterium]|nr:hypothetical protein [Gammaproteobacteria bacterium]